MAVGKKKRAGQRAQAASASTKKTSVARAATGKRSGNLRELPDVDPFAELPPQPEWVVREFPEYVEGSHVSGPVSTRRVSYAGGHEIEILTTYAVSIDGQPTPVHLLVDTDGRLWSHLCPYVTFANASELIAHLLTHAPEALTNLQTGGGHGGHAGGMA
jgi:hypothetical protein